MLINLEWIKKKYWGILDCKESPFEKKVHYFGKCPRTFSPPQKKNPVRLVFCFIMKILCDTKKCYVTAKI